jgi:hypothetical protein
MASFKYGISHSIEKIASIPYTNWKGVNPMEDLRDGR